MAWGSHIARVLITERAITMPASDYGPIAKMQERP
jgi:hypothetical protein